jgi:inosine-uridine preferring nucleoside hydrolase
MRRIGTCTLLMALVATASAVAQPAQKIIFDTDFAFPPQDDAMALVFVLNSPEIEILGITTVAGNRSRNVATADALKVLEVTNRGEIPVFEGAAAPLLHQGTEWDTKRHGGWFANDPAPAPPGGFAKRKAETRSAVDFLVSTVRQSPGQVTILALGQQLRAQRQTTGDHGRRHRLAPGRWRQPHPERRVQLLRGS